MWTASACTTREVMVIGAPSCDSRPAGQAGQPACDRPLASGSRWYAAAVGVAASPPQHAVGWFWSNGVSELATAWRVCGMSWPGRVSSQQHGYPEPHLDVRNRLHAHRMTVRTIHAQTGSQLVSFQRVSHACGMPLFAAQIDRPTKRLLELSCQGQDMPMKLQSEGACLLCGSRPDTAGLTYRAHADVTAQAPRMCVASLHDCLVNAEQHHEDGQSPGSARPTETG